MPVTLKDVAREAHVSNITVSRVLTGKRSAVPISEATRERVLEVAARLGYRPNLMARGLRTQRSGAIGVMVEDITDPFFVSLIPEVDSVLKSRGYHLLLSHAALDPQTGYTYDRLLGSWVDGLLVFGDRALRHEDEDKVLAHHRHVIGVACAREGSAIPSFNCDDNVGVRLAVAHLRGLGHEYIGFLGNRDVWDMSRRLDTFLEAMAADGLIVSTQALALVPHTAADGYAATRRLLADKVPLTALLCTTDLLALGALCALDDAGLHVPDDMSVIGWDDIPLAAYAVPPLTTVRQPIAELARRAVTHLLNLIDSREQELPDSPTVLLPPELIVRRTTGPRPANLAMLGPVAHVRRGSIDNGHPVATAHVPARQRRAELGRR